MQNRGVYMSNKKMLTQKQKTELETAIGDKRTLVKASQKNDCREYVLWHFKDNVTVDYFYVIIAHNSGRRVVKRNDVDVADSKTFNKQSDSKYIDERLTQIIDRYINELSAKIYRNAFAHVM